MSLPSASRAPLPTWRSGDPLLASKWQQTNDAVRLNQEALLPRQKRGPGQSQTSTPINSAEYVSRQTTEVEVPVYDVDDPNTQVGIATESVITSITWRLTIGGVTQDVEFPIPLET